MPICIINHNNNFLRNKYLYITKTMAHLVVLDSINEDIFVCGHCKLVFNSLQLFLDHKRIHSTTEVLESNTLTDLHRSNQLDENKVIDDKTLISEFSCKQCNKSFKKMKSLLVHLKTHSEKPYQCTVCGRCFVQNSHLHRHFMSHKVWPDGISKTTVKSLEIDILSYSCSYCNTVLSNYNQFRAHLKNHIHLKKFKCIQNECVQLFETVDNLIQHVSMFHDPPSYICHICKKKFNSLDDIAAHHQNHNMDEKTHMSENKQYKCSQCDATFKKVENLSLHMFTENHKKMCIYCNKIFASDKRLRLHLQIHNKVKQFQCTMCNSTFHMKKYLTSHMLRHGERQFSCSICKYRFKRQDLLQRHMKSHQLRKTFKCPFRDSLECKMEFNRSDKLKSHTRHHTKQMTLSDKSSKKNDPSTMEICIVPIDFYEMKM